MVSIALLEDVLLEIRGEFEVVIDLVVGGEKGLGLGEGFG